MSFSPKKHHIAWLVLPLLPAFVILIAAAVGSASTPPKAQLSIVHKEVDRMNARSIPSCDQIEGLCNAEERRLLMPRADALTIKRLRQQGCKIKHEMRSLTSLSCPDSVNLESARSERAFRITDLFSATHIRANSVWSEGVEGEGVRVAVLDTGVETSHPELEGKVIAQADFTGTGLQDAFGHGTHVSAIISGSGIKDLETNRVIGVSPNVSLLVGKVCRDDGWCLEGDILAGIEWAVQQKARVLNLSLGGGSFETHCDGDMLANAVNWAVEQGVVVVAAAGNTGAGVASPACASRAMAVGALDLLNTVPTWSSRGEALDFMAPGVDVLSAYSCEAVGSCPGPWYAKLSGTSMAAPHVAATVALVLQQHPALQPGAVYDLLAKTSVDIGSAGFDFLYGHGQVDALAAYALSNLTDPVQEDPTGGCIDVDGDGIDSCRDCNDLDKTVFPNAPEMCNKKDDNCNKLIDEFCRVGTPIDEKSTCGNGICDATENKSSCSIDCTTIIPPRAVEQSNGQAGGTSGNSENGSRSSNSAPVERGSSSAPASSNSSAGGSEGGSNSSASRGRR